MRRRGAWQRVSRNPLRRRPPIVVDGDLADWENVPNAIAIKDKAQVTAGADTWTGPADLSATVRLAWRRTG